MDYEATNFNFAVGIFETGKFARQNEQEKKITDYVTISTILTSFETSELGFETAITPLKTRQCNEDDLKHFNL